MIISHNKQKPKPESFWWQSKRHKHANEWLHLKIATATTVQKIVPLPERNILAPEILKWEQSNQSNGTHD
jgi:hypothetical protein